MSQQVPLAGVYATPGRQYYMSKLKGIVAGFAVTAWGIAGCLVQTDAPNRAFILAVVFAASLTVPLLTVMLARRHVHAYMAGWIDRGRAGNGPEGGSQQDGRRGLRAV